MLERLRSLFRALRRRKAGPRPAPQPNRRPRLEYLEDRITPDSSMSNMMSMMGMMQSLNSFVQSIPTPPDLFFLNYEARGDQQEILMGQLAQLRAGDPGTALFGQILASDHTRLLQQITPVLQSVGMPVPPLAPDNVQNIVPFLNLSGRQFSTQFNNFMVDDHLEDVSLTLAELQRGRLPQVQANALQALPTLDTHLILAVLLGGQAQGG